MKTNGETEVELCTLCKNDREWHRENNPRHPFTPPEGSLAFLGDGNKARQEAKERHPSRPVKVLQGLPSDPALRILLIEKGLVTQDELNDVERRIREAQANGSVIIVTPGGRRPTVDGVGGDLGPRDDRSAQGSLWSDSAGTSGVADPTPEQ